MELSLLFKLLLVAAPATALGFVHRLIGCGSSAFVDESVEVVSVVPSPDGSLCLWTLRDTSDQVLMLKVASSHFDDLTVYDSPWALSPVIKRGDAQVFSKDADLVGTTSIYSSQSQVVVRSMTTRPVQFDVSRVSKLRY